MTSFMLFLYAITFSYAYMNIDAGFGTLLLFGVVQVVMIVSSIYYKEQLTIIKLFWYCIIFMRTYLYALSSREF